MTSIECENCALQRVDKRTNGAFLSRQRANRGANGQSQLTGNE